MTAQHSPPTATASLREGVVTGVLGALVVALFYLVVDVTRGLPLLTPSVLGEVFVLRRPDVLVSTVDTTAVFLYSGVHLVLFVAFGLFLTALVTRAETSSVARYAVLQLFIAFMLFFLGVLAIASETTRGLFPWWSVLAANAIAAGVMGVWVWRRHPRLQRAMGRTPLGAPEMGEQ